LKLFRKFREQRRAAADRAKLIARWEKLKPIVEVAAAEALEADIKSGNLTVSETLRKMGEEVEGMSDEQFAAFLDVLEAGIPEEFKINREETTL
jgi:hypothetical protein